MYVRDDCGRAVVYMHAYAYVSVSLGVRVSASMCLALPTIICNLVGIKVVGPISLFDFVYVLT